MKAYQKKWLREIEGFRYIGAVCREIIKDDTGGTDPLAQALARKLLHVQENFERLCVEDLKRRGFDD